jgi:hypothetical protein
MWGVAMAWYGSSTNTAIDASGNTAFGAAGYPFPERSSDPARVGVTVAQAGIASELLVHLDIAPGGVHSVTVTLVKVKSDATVSNRVVDSGAPSCVITGSATTCTPSVGTLAFDKGDRLAIRTVRSSGSVVDHSVFWTVVFTAP